MFATIASGKTKDNRFRFRCNSRWQR